MLMAPASPSVASRALLVTKLQRLIEGLPPAICMAPPRKTAVLPLNVHPISTALPAVNRNPPPLPSPAFPVARLLRNLQLANRGVLVPFVPDSNPPPFSAELSRMTQLLNQG